MAGNPTFTTFLSSTIRNYKKKLVSVLIGHNALFWQLDKRGFVEEDKGGRSITQPLMYGENGTVRSFDGYDLIDVTPQEGITTAEYPWKYIAGSVTISQTEEFENSGDKSRIFNLLEAKIRQLEISMKKELNRQLFGDGTGNGGKDITGLGVAVEDGTAWAVYGGIDGADAGNSWWRNQYLNFTGAGYTTFVTTRGKSVEGLHVMRQMRNNCSRDKTKPGLIVTTQSLFEEYEGYIEGGQKRVMTNEVADAGFHSLLFTDIPIVFDEDLAANTMLFLNPEYLKLKIGKGMNFSTTDFQRPHNQLAKVAQVLFAGNIVMSRRDVHGRIVNFAV